MEDKSSTLPAVAASKVYHENLQRELDGTYWNHLMVKIKAADTIKTRQEYARFKVVRKAELKTMKAIAATLHPGLQLRRGRVQPGTGAEAVHCPDIFDLSSSLSR